jgi:hypothetical protein
MGVYRLSNRVVKSLTTAACAVLGAEWHAVKNPLGTADATAMFLTLTRETNWFASPRGERRSGG